MTEPSSLDPVSQTFVQTKNIFTSRVTTDSSDPAQSSPNLEEIPADSQVLKLIESVWRFTKLVVLNSKQNFSLLVVFVIYCCSNWSLALSNRKGYSIDLLDVILVLLVIFVVKAYLSGEGLAGFFDSLSKRAEQLMKASKKSPESTQDSNNELFSFQRTQTRNEVDLQNFQKDVNNADSDSNSLELLNQASSIGNDVSKILKTFKLACKARTQVSGDNGAKQLQNAFETAKKNLVQSGEANNASDRSGNSLNELSSALDKAIEEFIKKSETEKLDTTKFTPFFDQAYEIQMKNENSAGYSTRNPMSEALNLKESLEAANKEKAKTGIQKIMNTLAQWDFVCQSRKVDEPSELNILQDAFGAYVKEKFTPGQDKKQKGKLRDRLNEEKARLLSGFQLSGLQSALDQTEANAAHQKNQLQSTLEDLNKKLAQTQSDLDTQKSQSQLLLNEANEKAAQIAKDLENSSSTGKDKDALTSQLREQLKNLEAQNKEEQKKRAQEQAEIEEKLRQLQEASRIAEEKEKKSKKEAEEARIEAENAKLEREAERQQREKAQKDAEEKAKASEESQKLAEQAKTAAEQSQKQLQEAKQLADSLAKEKADAAEAERKRVAAEQESNSLNQSNQQALDQQREAQARKDEENRKALESERQAALAALEESNKAHASEIAQVKKNTEELLAQLKALIEENQQKTQRIAELEALIADLQQQLQEAQESIASSNEEKQKQEDELNELRKRCDDLSGEISELQAASNAAKEEQKVETPVVETSTTAVALPIGGAEELSLRKTTSMNASIQILEKSVRGITEVFYDKFRNTAYFNQNDQIEELKQQFGEDILSLEELTPEQKALIIARFEEKFLTSEEEFLSMNVGGESADTPKNAGNKKSIVSSLDKNFDTLKQRLNRAKDIADLQQVKIANESDEREASRLVDEMINGALTDTDDAFNRQLLALKKIMLKYKAPVNLKASTDLNASKRRPSVSAASVQKVKSKIESLLQYIAENMDNIKGQMRDYLSLDMRRTLKSKVAEWKKSQDDKNQVMQRWSLQSQNMWFTLIWHDANDLDLVVKCPCGQKIYYGTKKCESCGTYLEIDMNAGGNKNDKFPIEHVYLQKPPKIGSNWEVYVKMFHCNNNKDSHFVVQIEHEDGRISSYSGTIDINQNPVSPTYKYTVGKGIDENERKLIAKIRAVIDNQETFSFV